MEWASDSGKQGGRVKGGVAANSQSNHVKGAFGQDCRWYDFLSQKQKGNIGPYPINELFPWTGGELSRPPPVKKQGLWSGRHEIELRRTRGARWSRHFQEAKVNPHRTVLATSQSRSED